MAGLSGALASLAIDEYHTAVYKMPLRRLLIYLEERRVQKRFEDLKTDTHGP